MKSVIVCIAPDLSSLKKVLKFINLKHTHVCNKDVLYYIDFKTKTDARAYFAIDLVKSEYFFRERLRDIVAGRLNEYNIDYVNLSIRYGKEREDILRHIKSHPLYPL